MCYAEYGPGPAWVLWQGRQTEIPMHPVNRVDEPHQNIRPGKVPSAA